MDMYKQQNPTARDSVSKINGLSGIVNTGNTCYMNSAIQALCHNYHLVSYLFTKRSEILTILLKNAPKMLAQNKEFQIDNDQSMIPLELRRHIFDKDYDANKLTSDEANLIYNQSITFQLIRLLEGMWNRNCVIVPTSFKKIFCEARDQFFFGYAQHDAEEAYSCIIQKMQEELAEPGKKIVIRSNNMNVQKYLEIKTNIELSKTNAKNDNERSISENQYKLLRQQMPTESLIVDAELEQINHYKNNHCHVSEIFTGFLYSSIRCPTSACGFSSNRFDPFLHLSLPLPLDKLDITIYDCLREYCCEEVLDNDNLWNCEGCGNKVNAIKRLQFWTAPPVLVVQLKRFGFDRRFKDDRLVDYPLDNFDIGDFIAPEIRDNSKCYQYRLQCVIYHQSGQLDSGHYYTYCIDDDTQLWFEYNDKYVHAVADNNIVKNSAYLLFYMRRDFIRN